MPSPKRLVNYFLKLFVGFISFLGFENNLNSGGVCESSQCQRASAMIAKNMNNNVNQCADFYEYACGNFKIDNPIPPNKLFISPYTVRRDEINKKILDFFKNTDLRRYPNIQKIYLIYSQCMNEGPYDMNAIINELRLVGLHELPPYHLDLDGIIDEITVLAKIQRYSSMSAFAFNVIVELDYKNLPSNHIYFSKTPNASGAPVKTDDVNTEFEATADEIRTALIRLIAKTTTFFYETLGVKITRTVGQKIVNRIQEVADFLLQLDEATNIDKFHEHEDAVTFKTRSEFQTWTDNILEGGSIKIDWDVYFGTLFRDISDINNKSKNEYAKKIMMLSENQVKYVLQVFKRTKRSVLVCAMWFVVVRSMSFFSPKSLQNMVMEYDATVYRTVIPSISQVKNENCISLFGNHFTDLVGYILAFKEDGLRTKMEILRMVANIKRSFQKVIQETTWLDSQTKIIAIRKLKSITSYIAFLNFHLDIKTLDRGYNELILGENFYTTLNLMVRKGTEKKLRTILTKNIFRNKVNINTFSMTATYFQDYIHFNIPIAILAFPFYKLGLDALNYGAIGMLIAHELGHAFDIQGCNRPGNGVYKFWLSDSARQEYDKRAKCFQVFYGKFYFEEVNNKKVDGRATLDENIADSIGFAVALRAYRNQKRFYKKEKKLKGFENYTPEQLFVMAFANIWCKHLSPRGLKNAIEEDNHSPEKVRVNGTLMNSKEFGAIFDCEIGTPMNPIKNDKCTIFD